MNNAFCYSRDKETSLYGMFSKRMEGACLTLLRYLTIHANHSPGYYAGHPIQRGEIAASLNHLESHTGLSQKTIRNALDHLQKANEVCQKGAVKGANRTMLYCVVNYEDWDDYAKKGQSEGQARGKQGATSKEEVKKKKEENTGRDIAREAAAEPEKAQAIFTVNHEPNPHPDPTYSPEALMTRWTSAKLPLARSVAPMLHLEAFRRLHHEPPFWTRQDVEQAIDKLAADKAGTGELAWAWKGGPSYLVKKKTVEDRQGIEKVLAWTINSEAHKNGQHIPKPRDHKQEMRDHLAAKRAKEGSV